MTRVLITVDTELTSGHHRPGASWRGNLAASFDPAGVGVPWQLERLHAHGLKACFFVDPMPAELYGLEPIRRMVEPVLAAGQEVQLHLHPGWRGLIPGGDRGRCELTAFDLAEQRELIATARRLLIEAGAPDPIAFRAGSYAANADTLSALAGAGIRFDSSHNGSHHPWPSALPLDPRLAVPVELNGIAEIPVSQIEDARGRLRHLQLCAVSFDEMKAALLHAEAEAQPIVTLVSHSFELASRDGRRANRTLCRRFEKLCCFLDEHRDRFPTAHFSDLDDLPLGGEGALLPPRPLRTARRMIEQLWSNAVYERAL